MHGLASVDRMSVSRSDQAAGPAAVANSMLMSLEAARLELDEALPAGSWFSPTPPPGDTPRRPPADAPVPQSGILVPCRMLVELFRAGWLNCP